MSLPTVVARQSLTAEDDVTVTVEAIRAGNVRQVGLSCVDDELGPIPVILTPQHARDIAGMLLRAADGTP